MRNFGFFVNQIVKSLQKKVRANVQSGQIVIEYFLLFATVTACIISTLLLHNSQSPIKNSYDTHFKSMIGHILGAK